MRTACLPNAKHQSSRILSLLAVLTALLGGCQEDPIALEPAPTNSHHTSTASSGWTVLPDLGEGGAVIAVQDAASMVGWIGVGASVAVRWRNGGVSLLPRPTGAVSYSAIDINSNGDVLGRYDVDTDPLAPSRFVIWDRNDAIVAEVPLDNALGFNDSRTVVGHVRKTDGSRIAARWRNGTVERIGPDVAEYSTAAAVNDFGLIAGRIMSESAITPAIWKPDGTLDTFLPDGIAAFYDINDLGQATGSSAYPADAAIFLENGLIYEIPDDPSARTGRGVAVNDNSVVVGVSDGDPWVWLGGSSTMPLPVPSGGGTAHDIGNDGTIGGGVRDASGVLRAAYWTVEGAGQLTIPPGLLIPPAAEDVPEGRPDSRGAQPRPQPSDKVGWIWLCKEESNRAPTPPSGYVWTATRSSGLCPGRHFNEYKFTDTSRIPVGLTIEPCFDRGEAGTWPALPAGWILIDDGLPLSRPSSRHPCGGTRKRPNAIFHLNSWPQTFLRVF